LLFVTNKIRFICPKRSVDSTSRKVEE